MFINNNKKFLITTTLFSLLLANYNFATAADADNANNANNANTEVNATITSTTTNAKTNENNADDANNSTRNPINFLGLTDPTKPPNASDSYDADGNMVANSGHPVLQGVLLQSNGRKVAVINAKSYHPGDSINIGGENLKLSRINEDNVVLSGGSAGQITLSLTPAVNKNLVSSKKNKNNKK